MHGRAGFSFIELLVVLGLLAILFGGIFLAYATILDTLTNSERRTAAVSVINKQFEVIRNLSYEDVGTTTGIPVGIILEHQTTTFGEYLFAVTTTVRNIDDPFDGTVNGNPLDAAPADYKLVELEVECLSCVNPTAIVATGRVAPKHLESASMNGSLFVNAFNASGLPIAGATVHVVNQSTSPPIDLTDTTNASGTLQILDVPTSTQSYQITVSRSGFSTDKTYAVGAVGNPNPIVPHATVVPQTITQTSFVIDELATLTIDSRDAVCNAIASQPFALRGTKLIGTNPNVHKFATTTVTTNALGIYTTSSLEWDTYALVFTGSRDLAGMISMPPLVLNPSSSVRVSAILANANPNSLLVSLRDSVTGGTISDTDVVVSLGAFSATQRTHRAFVTHTDWSGNNYAAQDGGMDADLNPGLLTLLAQGGLYSTSTESWLISNTIDVGSSTSQFFTLNWAPTAQPGGTTMRFQVASNNDNATWNFVGPDGTPSSYYTLSGQTMPGVHTNDRYVRYRVHMSTTDEIVTPQLDSISVEFRGACVPPSQTLFQGLTTDTYDVSALRAGYELATTTIAVGAGWNEVELPMIPL